MFLTDRRRQLMKEEFFYLSAEQKWLSEYSTVHLLNKRGTTVLAEICGSDGA
jgi:hypothetical protein